MLLFVSLLTTGNVLWKFGLTNMGGFFVNGKTFLSSIKELFFSPHIWSGTILYIIGTLYWFILLSRHNLSYIYPMVSIAYVFGTIAGMIFFKETIPVTGWVGLGVIFVGFLVLSIR